MTTSDDQEQPEVTADEPTEHDDGGRLAILRLLITQIAYDSGGELSVALHVDGAIVQGKAVSNHRWLRAMIPDTATAEEGTVGASIHRLATEWESADLADLDPAEMRHVNLVDAVLKIGNNTIHSKVWQVPFARIAGWTLGGFDFDSSTRDGGDSNSLS